MAKSDKRKMERFPLEFTGHIEVVTEQENESIELVTRDICAGGALFHSDKTVPVGSKVKVDLVMPIDQLRTIKTEKILIKVSGTVVRTDERGMAVCFSNRYKITPLKG